MTATERDAMNRLSYRRQIAAALNAVVKLTGRIECDCHNAEAPMPADLTAVTAALDAATDMLNEAAAELAAPDA